MVKKRVGGGQRFRSAAAAAAAAATAGSKGAGSQPSGPLPPQHVQRKVNRKVKFLEKIAASQKASLAAPGRGVTKKRKAKPLPTLDSLAGALSELGAGGEAGGAAGGGGGGGGLSGKAKHMASKGRGSSVKRLKARQAIALSEAHRLQQVLEHPSYQADPLAAITHHLQATLPPPPPAKAAAGAGGKQRRKGGKQPGPKRKAAQSGMQMD
ncbi:MAG: hypothetical protein J3K34DRAFT_396195 [Monoraphidium minutum]|nr:MAG: hypothetical protein J3K34DRAFT_396195 [Monoraphidium minutum]